MTGTNAISAVWKSVWHGKASARSRFTDEDYRALAAIRYALKRFIHFSEDAARSVGLTPQQHQALLAIRAGKERAISVGELSKLLLVQPHSASNLQTGFPLLVL